MRAKGLVVLGLLSVVVILLAVSNPREDEFVRWFESHTTAGVSEQRGFGKIVAGLTALAMNLETRTSVRRDNYVLFSVFHVRVAGRDHAFLGVLGQFVSSGDGGS